MHELSIFTGAGGGVLGTKLLGWKTIGYVEIDDYCQRVIQARIKDGILDEAPIFGDIRAFLREGYAESYQGMVDVVTAGFPCQPFSVAGKELGEKDPRNMWPETIECIRRIRPQFALLENVPNLLFFDYFGSILGDLASLGYYVKWKVLGSSDVGGVIIGQRLWVLAKTDGFISRTDDSIYSVPNKEKHIRVRSSWPSLENVDKVFMLSNGFIVPETTSMAPWVDEFKAIGNGQDPFLAAEVWRMLS